MENLDWTGERLVTQVSNIHGVIEHLHRYAIAKSLSKNKSVLDIASGEGYGSFLLSGDARSVIGVDIDEKSILHASKKYEGAKNLRFIKGSTSDIPVANDEIDLVVSFETLEHHNEHDQMMLEIKRVLKQGGMLLLSSPEKSIYSKRDPNNPYHIQELTLAEFERLLRRHFRNVIIFTQMFIAGSLIRANNNFGIPYLETFNGDYKKINSGLVPDEFYNQPFFNLALCSDAEIDINDFLNVSFFDGSNVIKSELDELRSQNNKTLNSKSYKIGNRFVRVYLFIKNLFRK